MRWILVSKEAPPLTMDLGPYLRRKPVSQDSDQQEEPQDFDTQPNSNTRAHEISPSSTWPKNGQPSLQGDKNRKFKVHTI